MSPNRFVLQFALSDLAGLATRYGYRQDEGAFAAGRNIVNGNYGRENLKVIVRWKSARKIGFIDDNTDAEIAHALRFASAPGISENSAVEIQASRSGRAYGLRHPYNNPSGQVHNH
jgi:hypothetical protein